MNIAGYHSEDKKVSSKLVFSGEGKVIALHIKAGEKLAEHITPVPAFLICITGKANFENELGFHRIMYAGETMQIDPNVKHWITASTDCDFLLIK